MVMVGLTISMHFQQFEDLIFFRGVCPRTHQKPLQSVQTSVVRLFFGGGGGGGLLAAIFENILAVRDIK